MGVRSQSKSNGLRGSRNLGRPPGHKEMRISFWKLLGIGAACAMAGCASSSQIKREIDALPRLKTSETQFLNAVYRKNGSWRIVSVARGGDGALDPDSLKFELRGAAAKALFRLRSPTQYSKSDFLDGLTAVATAASALNQSVFGDSAPGLEVSLLVAPGFRSHFAEHTVRDDNVVTIEYPVSEKYFNAAQFNKFNLDLGKIAHETYHALVGVSAAGQGSRNLEELSARLYAACFEFAVYERTYRPLVSKRTEQGRHTFTDSELQQIENDGGRAVVRRYGKHAAADILFQTVWTHFFGGRNWVFAGDEGQTEFMKICSSRYLARPSDIARVIGEAAADERDAPASIPFVPPTERWANAPAPWAKKVN
ncbi:MAG: hypothetical protein HXY23_05410 [Parvularculaceae bacterium]|nr:hypothetical protein [Parvularculaceae bacterium]